MLELRPSCEHCNRALPPDSLEARICSFECTFCTTCVNELLDNVCPNCGGGFVARPIRPARHWKGDNHLGKCPAGTRVRHRPVEPDPRPETSLRRRKIMATFHPVALTLLLIAGPAAHADSADLAKLAWLGGCWKSESGEPGSVEQ